MNAFAGTVAAMVPLAEVKAMGDNTADMSGAMPPAGGKVPTRPGGPRKTTGWWRSGIASTQQQAAFKNLGITGGSSGAGRMMEQQTKELAEKREQRALDKQREIKAAKADAEARALRIAAQTQNENARAQDHRRKTIVMADQAAADAAKNRAAMAKVLEGDAASDGPAITKRAVAKRKEFLASAKASAFLTPKQRLTFHVVRKRAGDDITIQVRK
jgi:hypothetical protein